MGHMAIIMHGSRWQTGVIGHMGNVAHGQWGMWVMRHMGIIMHRSKWGQGWWGKLTMGHILTSFWQLDIFTHYLNLNHLSPSQGYFSGIGWGTCLRKPSDWTSSIELIRLPVLYRTWIWSWSLNLNLNLRLIKNTHKSTKKRLSSTMCPNTVNPHY